MRVSPEIESLIPYIPGKPIEETKRELGLEHVIKLASNENPLGPSPKAVEAIHKACQDLARYPDPTCFLLRASLARKWNVAADEIVIGNGSNELIDLLIRVFCEPGDKVIYPEKSFVAYSVCAQAARVSRMEIPVDAKFDWDVDKFLDNFKRNSRGNEKILFIANPNNPTGTYLNQEKTKRLLDDLGGREDLLIVFDEAYNEYVRAADFPRALDFYKQHSNVLVLRTFSKIYGLAGLRVGALVGRREHLDFINRVRNPFNVNSLAQEATLAAMEDHEYLKESQRVSWAGLDALYPFLQERGLPYTPSQTNFVLFDTLRDGQEVFQEAMKRGLLLRPLSSYGLPNHIRMSIGTAEEMKQAQGILDQALAVVDKK